MTDQVATSSSVMSQQMEVQALQSMDIDGAQALPEGPSDSALAQVPG